MFLLTSFLSWSPLQLLRMNRKARINQTKSKLGKILLGHLWILTNFLQISLLQSQFHVRFTSTSCSKSTCTPSCQIFLYFNQIFKHFVDIHIQLWIRSKGTVINSCFTSSFSKQFQTDVCAHSEDPS